MFTKRARRELFLITVLLLAGQLFYIIFYHDSGYRQLMSRRSELQRLQLENESLVQEQRAFEERIRRLEHDPQFFEDFIRDRYPYAKRGDIIVNIQKPRR